MSGALERQAEILKLARLLRRDPATLDYLEQVPAGDIGALREQITDVLFAEGDKALRRLAAASRVLPAPLIATIAQRAFGPLLSARMAGILEPGRAADVAERLPVDFLADVALELDPRRTSDVVARIPAAKVAAITSVLVRREEYVMMGRFVGCLGDEALTASLEAMDDTALLQVAFVLEAKENLDHLLDLVGTDRLESAIDSAGREQLWAEILDLLANLSERRRAALIEQPGLRRRVTQEIARLDPSSREAILDGLRNTGLADELAVLEEELGGTPS